jgi:site-specific recombinase XerC
MNQPGTDHRTRITGAGHCRWRAGRHALPRIRDRNPHTRPVYARAADEFLAWCASAGVPSIGAVQPVHVATWIEAGTRALAAPSVKRRLAAIRHLFDWLVTGDPAGSVRGPRHVVTVGQTSVLDLAEARALLTASTRRPSSVCAIAP